MGWPGGPAGVQARGGGLSQTVLEVLGRPGPGQAGVLPRGLVAPPRRERDPQGRAGTVRGAESDARVRPGSAAVTQDVGRSCPGE